MITKSKALPSVTLGKSGNEIFSCHKDLTMVMAPFERFSSLSKAVDDLFRFIKIPFNLIVVESCAPESVRAALEARRKRHRNITVVYSNNRPTMWGAFNLAIPHIKTKYSFFMDSEIKVPVGTIEKLIQHADEHRGDVLCPEHSMIHRSFSFGDGKDSIQNMETLGVRNCFLISLDALNKLGKFDPQMTAFTGGIDLTFTAKSKGLTICKEPEVHVESHQSSARSEDYELYGFQWSQDLNDLATARLNEKWNISLPQDPYVKWLEAKYKKIVLHQQGSPIFFLRQLFHYLLRTGKQLTG